MTTAWDLHNHSLRFLSQDTMVAQVTRDLLAKDPELLRLPVVLQALLVGTRRPDSYPTRLHPNDRESARAACLYVLVDNAEHVLGALQQISENHDVYSSARGIVHALRERSIPRWAPSSDPHGDLEAATAAIDTLTMLAEWGKLRVSDEIVRAAVEIVTEAREPGSAPRDRFLRAKYAHRADACCDLLELGVCKGWISLDTVRLAALWAPTPQAGLRIERALVKARRLDPSDDSIEVERLRLAVLHKHHPCRSFLGEMAWRYAANRDRLGSVVKVAPEAIDVDTVRYAVHAATDTDTMRLVLTKARESIPHITAALAEFARYGKGHLIYDAASQMIAEFVIHAIREGRAYIDKQYGSTLDGAYVAEVLKPAAAVLRACARDVPSTTEHRVVLCGAARWLQDRTMSRNKPEYEAILLDLVFALSMWDEASVEGMADLLGYTAVSLDLTWRTAAAIVLSLKKTQQARSTPDEHTQT